MTKKHITDILDLLVDTAYQVLEWKITFAMNIEEINEDIPMGYLNFDHKRLDEIVDIIKPLLQKAQQVRELEAKNSQDILKMLGSGKISANEARGLLSLMKEKLIVEEQETKTKIAKQIAGIV